MWDTDAIATRKTNLDVRWRSWIPGLRIVSNRGLLRPRIARLRPDNRPNDVGQLCQSHGQEDQCARLRDVAARERKNLL